MAPLACAIDLGTSSAKLALVGDDGSVVGSRTVEYALRAPRPGWAETEPAEWLSSVRAGLADLLGTVPGRVTAVGIDGQMHGLVLGAGKRPLRPAMLWPDSRAQDEVSRWAHLPDSLRAPLANPPAAGMFGPMLAWLVRHESALLAEAEYACSPKDWLRHQFTDSPMVTDASDASATLAWHVPQHGWHTELLDAVGIPTSLLPPVRASTQAVETDGTFGLPPGLPMSVGVADTAATLLATQLQPGEALVNVGTGIQVCSGGATPRADARPRFHTFVDAEGTWYAMVAPLNGGLALNRVRELLRAGWDEMYASLGAPSAGGSSVFFTPWFTGDRLPDERVGGSAGWQGLGLGSTRTDLLRAALESTAFQVARAIESLPTRPDSIRLSGGGTRDPLMRQLIVDAIGLPARRASNADATVLGAALVGFRAAGMDPEWPVPRDDELAEPRRDPALRERRRLFDAAADQQLER